MYEFNAGRAHDADSVNKFAALITWRVRLKQWREIKVWVTEQVFCIMTTLEYSGTKRVFYLFQTSPN